MDRLEHALKEKRGKIREMTKKVGESKVDIVVAKTKRDIAARRLKDIGSVDET